MSKEKATLFGFLGAAMAGIFYMFGKGLMTKDKTLIALEQLEAAVGLITTTKDATLVTMRAQVIGARVLYDLKEAWKESEAQVREDLGDNLAYRHQWKKAVDEGHGVNNKILASLERIEKLIDPLGGLADPPDLTEPEGTEDGG